MSNDMMNRIWWREDIKGVTKNVAVALADAASDQGMCFPAVDTLALKCGWGKRAVQNALNDLEGMGLLRRIHRTDSSTVYQFVIDNMPLIEKRPSRNKERDLFATGASGAREGCTGFTPPMNEVHPTPARDSPRTLSEPKEEPSLFTGSLALPAVPSEEETISQMVDSVAQRWNEEAEKHPGMQKARLPLDDSRRNAIIQRSKRTEEGQSVNELWAQFFDHIAASPFLQGRIAPGPGRSSAFKLSMTWALKSSNFNEIMEGKYGKSDRDRSTTAADGRAMGPGEQGVRAALAARRVARDRRRAG